MTGNDYQIIFYLCLSAVIVWKICGIIDKRRKKAKDDYNDEYPIFPEITSTKDMFKGIDYYPPYTPSRMQELFSTSKRYIHDLYDGVQDIILESYIENSMKDGKVFISFQQSTIKERTHRQLTFNSDDLLISYKDESFQLSKEDSQE